MAGGLHAGPPVRKDPETRQSGTHRVVKLEPKSPRAGWGTALLGAMLVTILVGMVALAGLIVVRTPSLPVVPARPVVVTVPPAPAPTVIITTPRKAPTPHG